MKANEILRQSAQHIEDRASQRDQDGGERSMARCVAAFNALTGHQLSERDGWLFMVQLKAARATTTATGLADDYQDGAAYFALAGESVAMAVANDNAAESNIEIPVEGAANMVVPPGYNWIAQDADGRWFAYAEKPMLMDDEWSAGPGRNGNPYVKTLDARTSAGAWIDSLRKVR